MERDYAGLVVELIWLGGKKVALRVKDGVKDEVVVSIPNTSALDAFNHPFVYMNTCEHIPSRDIVSAINEYSQ